MNRRCAEEVRSFVGCCWITNAVWVHRQESRRWGSERVTQLWLRLHLSVSTTIVMLLRRCGGSDCCYMPIIVCVCVRVCIVSWIFVCLPGRLASWLFVLSIVWLWLEAMENVFDLLAFQARQAARIVAGVRRRHKQIEVSACARRRRSGRTLPQLRSMYEYVCKNIPHNATYCLALFLLGPYSSLDNNSSLYANKLSVRTLLLCLSC